MVDVNKDPLRLPKNVRQYALNYQNSMFANRPRLLVEIHGHSSGRYDIEVSSGFELDPSRLADAAYLTKLELFRRSLREALENRLGKRPTVGVWPLDRDVEKTATNTFTFQKVRRARQRSGLEWYGLHIELNAALRVGSGIKNSQVKSLPPQVVEVFSEALATAIRAAFEPLPAPDSTIPILKDSASPFIVVNEVTFKVGYSTKDTTNQNLVMLHPDALHSLGVLERDPILVRFGEEELYSHVASSYLIEPGQAALSQRMCYQINTSVGQKISLGRLVKRPDGNTTGTYSVPEPDVVVHQIEPGKVARLWLTQGDVDRLALRLYEPINLLGRAGMPATSVKTAVINPTLPSRAIVLSDGLASQLGITIGETLHLIQG
jgi:hypothetical protein